MKYPSILDYRCGRRTLGLLAITSALAVVGVGCAAPPQPAQPASGLTTIKGSGKAASKDLSVADFSAVSAGNGFNVEIRAGSAYAVRITADDNVLAYVKAEKAGDTLQVGLKDGSYTTTVLRAEITTPKLAQVTASGGSIVRLSGFTKAQDLQVGLSGGSQLEGELAANLLKIEAGGGSQARLALPAKDADVTLKGGSQANLSVSGRLDVYADGGSILTYSGNPTLGKQNVSGGAQIVRR